MVRIGIIMALLYEVINGEGFELPMQMEEPQPMKLVIVWDYCIHFMMDAEAIAQIAVIGYVIHRPSLCQAGDVLKLKIHARMILGVQAHTHQMSLI